MRIYMMTDLEGVAGVQNSLNWTRPGQFFYPLARQLLTQEVNAAIEGFFDVGVSSILVADGHGPSGVDVQDLDPRVEYLRGWPQGWPLTMEEGGFDFLVFVGQHAKSRTPCSNMTHTQNFRNLEISVNGQSIGEFGQMSMCASELGIRTIFASGEKALAAEAEDLFPGIETVSVKRGTRRSRGDECSEEEYRAHSQGAVHMHPQNARKKIRTGACQALKRATKDKSFGLVPMKGPYSRTHVIRHHEGDLRRMYDVVEHSNHFAGVLNLSNDNLRPVESDEHLCELLVG
ncbi:MAG: M55 family metallopeptidase [Candidatus Latescibacterota bacterium]|nr:M55 family metallopeptidase [Candidatus Latescibacterota bacterium]